VAQYTIVMLSLLTYFVALVLASKTTGIGFRNAGLESIPELFADCLMAVNSAWFLWSGEVKESQGMHKYQGAKVNKDAQKFLQSDKHLR